MQALMCNETNTENILPRRIVQVWKVDLDAHAYQSGDFYKVLSQDEQCRALRYQFVTDRQRFIVARGILRFLLADYLDVHPHEIRFGYGPGGKPEVIKPDTQLTFNLSHSGSTALYAVSRECEIGIDIEALHFDCAAESIASLIFSDREQAIFDTFPVDQKTVALLRGWTRKEAYVKARGTGLFFPLKQIEVPFGPVVSNFRINTEYRLHTEGHFRLYSFSVFPGYESALVIGGAPALIMFKTWPEQTDVIEVATRYLEERNHSENAAFRLY
ncbi:hypothetical protein Nstercoris_00350 [Nitrosomonas stercoris]|uniref:Uncharacterized protein n=1 Tax=Nitrosomonas stercoris TaxID=1444684 RepID=A0A4Y1YM73_9PROT|nr:hypothetical protein Nstercoris_00350 [Nitrosomonas stercoris]